MLDEISEIDVIIDLDDDDDDDNKVNGHDKLQTTISKVQPIYEFSNKKMKGFFRVCKLVSYIKLLHRY